MLGDAPLRIFLAYSEKDEAFAQHLARDLRSALGEGGDIHAESPLGREGDAAAWRAVQAHIAAADVYIIVLSPSALASSWINAQIDIAWRRRAEGLVILPVRYRDAQIREDLELLQFVSFLPPKSYEMALTETRALLARVLVQKQASLQMRTAPLTAPALPFGEAEPVLAPRPDAVSFTRRSLMPVLSVAFLAVVVFAALLLGQRKLAADRANDLATQTRTAASQATQIARTHVAFQTQVVPTLTAVSVKGTAAAVATATYQAGQSYTASVPGCPADLNWRFPASPDPKRPTYVCSSDNIQLLTQPTVLYSGGGLTFTGAQSYKAGIPIKHDIQVEVYDLQAHGQDAEFSFSDGLFTFVWGNAYWMFQTDSPGCSLCQSGQANLPSHFTVRMVYDGKQGAVSIDGARYSTIDKVSDFQTSSGIYIQYSYFQTSQQGVEVRVKNFRFTPLH